MKNREELDKMATKEFTPKEMLPAKKLRMLSQRDLLELTKQHKVGIIVKDELKIAMLNMEVFESMVDYINELEETIEDFELATRFGDRIKTPETKWEKQPANQSFSEWYQDRKKGSHNE